MQYWQDCSVRTSERALTHSLITCHLQLMCVCVCASACVFIPVEFLKLDLSSLQSVRDFVASFKERKLPLNTLVNNGRWCFHAGGVWAVSYGYVWRGPEMCFLIFTATTTMHIIHVMTTVVSYCFPQ